MVGGEGAGATARRPAGRGRGGALPLLILSPLPSPPSPHPQPRPRVPRRQATRRETPRPPRRRAVRSGAGGWGQMSEETGGKKKNRRCGPPRSLPPLRSLARARARTSSAQAGAGWWKPSSASSESAQSPTLRREEAVDSLPWRGGGGGGAGAGSSSLGLRLVRASNTFLEATRLMVGRGRVYRGAGGCVGGGRNGQTGRETRWGPEEADRG